MVFINSNCFYLLALAFCLFSISVNAQTSPPNSPDSLGDYYHNETHEKGTIPSGSHLMAGGLWRVVTPVLNCREKPGISYPIIRQFQRETIIQVEVGRGGSDEVLKNALDQNRLPWMFVRGIEGENNLENNLEKKCYVRANQRYIQPYSLPSK